MKLAECRGDWALVTGASSGIGRAFAVQLAAVGVNLALVARREPLLRALAEEIEQRHAVRALAMPIDLGKPDAATAIKARLASNGIKIRLLVNNAAFGHWGRFENGTQTAYQDMIQVNVSAMVALCQAFLPDLSGFSSSAIINVSSPAAFQPVPYMAVYAASKAFVSSFSQALYG